MAAMANAYYFAADATALRSEQQPRQLSPTDTSG